MLRGGNRFVVFKYDVFMDRERVAVHAYREMPRVRVRIKILNEQSREVVEPSALVYDAKELGQSLGLKYGELKGRLPDQASPASPKNESFQDDTSNR